MPLFNIISKCSGLNNKVSPKMLVHNSPKTGLTDIAEGANWDINDAGYLETRLGQVKITATPGQVFCDGGDCLAVLDRSSDSAIHRMYSNRTFSLPIVTGLVKSARVSWFQVGGKTYYSNGTQNGRIAGAVRSAWPTNSAYATGDTRAYSDAPVGSHIAYFLGRAWVSVEDAIYCSLPFRPGRFRFSKYYFRLNSKVLMMRPVAGGVWVSDSETTGFITPAQSWEAYSYTRKASVPAHEWSDNQRLVDLRKSHLQIPGLSAVWSSDEGLCIGTPDGQLIVDTENRLEYPSGTIGATVVRGNTVINTVF